MIRLSSKKGFTLVEMLVVISIVTMLSGSLYANYRQGQRNNSLRDATNSVVSIMRQAQSQSLAGVQYQNLSTVGYKVVMSRANRTYQLCAIAASDAAAIGCPANRVVQTLRLPDKITFPAIVLEEPSGNMIQANNASVEFKNPYGEVTYMSDGFVGRKTRGKLAITVKGSGSSIKTITLDPISGIIATQ